MGVATQAARSAVGEGEEEVTESPPERCCCGGLYAEHGGARTLYCPTGPSALCEGSAREGGRIWPNPNRPLRRNQLPSPSRISPSSLLRARRPRRTPPAYA